MGRPSAREIDANVVLVIRVEGVAADVMGNVYGATVPTRMLQKYVVRAR